MTICMTGGIFFYCNCKVILENLDLFTLAYVFKLLGQTVCIRHPHAKQTKLKEL
jgi:hypothetical protein